LGRSEKNKIADRFKGFQIIRIRPSTNKNDYGPVEAPLGISTGRAIFV
jgi:hypothetical protein